MKNLIKQVFSKERARLGSIGGNSKLMQRNYAIEYKKLQHNCTAAAGNLGDSELLQQLRDEPASLYGIPPDEVDNRILISGNIIKQRFPEAQRVLNDYQEKSRILFLLKDLPKSGGSDTQQSNRRHLKALVGNEIELYRGVPISVESTKNPVDTQELLESLLSAMALNFFLSCDVAGSTDIRRFKNVPWDKALVDILSEKGLKFYAGGGIAVGKADLVDAALSENGY